MATDMKDNLRDPEFALGYLQACLDEAKANDDTRIFFRRFGMSRGPTQGTSANQNPTRTRTHDLQWKVIAANQKNSHLPNGVIGNQWKQSNTKRRRNRAARNRKSTRTVSVPR